MQDVQLDISQLQADIARREQQIRSLETEISALEREISDFKADYDRVVGPVATRLETIRQVVDDLEKQAALRHLGDWNPPGAGWTPPQGYVSVEEQYRRTWQTPPPGPAPDPLIRTPFTAAPPDPLDQDARLKQLYRQLVRQYHPDLAQTPAEADYRNRLMVMINEAYAQRDLNALETVMQASGMRGRLDPEMPLALLQARQLRQTLRELDQRVSELERERHDLLHCDLMSLKIETKLAQMKGRSRLQEIAAEMEKQYWEYVARLDALRRG